MKTISPTAKSPSATGGAAKPRYKNRSSQKVYDAMLAMAEDKSSELYNKDGSQHGGANGRLAFWGGFNGATQLNGVPLGKKYPAGTLLSVAYQAGKEFARRSRKKT